jgi:hypothetical protein
MAEIPQNIDGEMKDVSALQNTCNTLEKGLTAKLKSLKAGIDPKKRKVTEGIFEEFDGKRSELGKVVLKEGGDGKNTAHIKQVETKIEISRS